MNCVAMKLKDTSSYRSGELNKPHTNTQTWVQTTCRHQVMNALNPAGLPMLTPIPKASAPTHAAAYLTLSDAHSFASAPPCWPTTDIRRDRVPRFAADPARRRAEPIAGGTRASSPPAFASSTAAMVWGHLKPAPAACIVGTWAREAWGTRGGGVSDGMAGAESTRGRPQPGLSLHWDVHTDHARAGATSVCTPPSVGGPCELNMHHMHSDIVSRTHGGLQAHPYCAQDHAHSSHDTLWEA